MFLIVRLRPYSPSSSRTLPVVVVGPMWLVDGRPAGGGGDADAAAAAGGVAVFCGPCGPVAMVGGGCVQGCVSANTELVT